MLPTGNVNASSYIGSLIGYLSYVTTIRDCFVLGNTNGGAAIVGQNGSSSSNKNSSLINCYAATNSNILFKGSYAPGITNCYIDSDQAAGNVDAKFARTIQEMMRRETYEDWDFDTVWTFVDEFTYPLLPALSAPDDTYIAEGLMNIS